MNTFDPMSFVVGIATGFFIFCIVVGTIAVMIKNSVQASIKKIKESNTPNLMRQAQTLDPEIKDKLKSIFMDEVLKRTHRGNQDYEGR